MRCIKGTDKTLQYQHHLNQRFYLFFQRNNSQFHLQVHLFFKSPTIHAAIKMQAFTTVLAAFAAINAVSGSPLLARNTCGSAPSASGSQTPLEQSATIQTAQACQDACNANGQCHAFVFGMVDNVTKCLLYSVPAAQIPTQSSQNLVVYDKACASVPAVVPTTANPTGANQSSNSDSNSNQQETSKTGQKLAVRNTCGTTPAGSSTSQAPLSQPANINSVADCLAQCKASPSCKSFEFGTVNGAKTCRLFAVAAASVPPPTSGQSFQVYDAACSI